MVLCLAGYPSGCAGANKIRPRYTWSSCTLILLFCLGLVLKVPVRRESCCCRNCCHKGKLSNLNYGFWQILPGHKESEFCLYVKIASEKFCSAGIPFLLHVFQRQEFLCLFTRLLDLCLLIFEYILVYRCCLQWRCR